MNWKYHIYLRTPRMIQGDLNYTQQFDSMSLRMGP